ncbi:MAG TPA: hypothetical protein VFE05_11960 [Longimicrobiaceae bacterium]|nr:hypothetical protein [Longimicrobiaceae bacterium]
MANIGKKLMWAVLGGVASKAARGMTRNALHTRGGAPRLPQPARRQRGMGTALAFALGTGAILAVADVLSEQGKTAARAKQPEPAR